MTKRQSNKQLANRDVISGRASLIVLGVLLVLVALFNLGLAPQQLSTEGFMTTTRDPQYGLFILGLLNSVVCIVMLVRIRHIKASVVVAIGLVVVLLTLYAYFAGFSA